ncbi:MAG: hypothetical protein R3F33_08185, partial [Planctomycetota bacterium]
YINTQRYPGPMGGNPENLPEGASDIFKAGPEEALVMRISDPVYLRRPGESSSFPVHFFRKRVLIGAGYWVLSEAGGRVDLVFGRGAELSLSGNNTIVLGSPSRGEPLVAFLEVENARLTLSANEYVELLGGALLSGEGGPMVIEHPREEVLILSNRSPNPSQLRYRDAVIDLAPGEVLHIPLIATGTHPQEPAIGFQTVDAAGGRIQLRGSLRILEQDGSRLRVEATGEHEVRGKGVVLRLDPGNRVEFDDLGDRE